MNVHPNSNSPGYVAVQIDPSATSGRRHSFAEDPTSRAARRVVDVNSNPSIKRSRPEDLEVNVSILSPLGSASASGVDLNHKSPSALLDPSTTHELVNCKFDTIIFHD